MRRFMGADNARPSASRLNAFSREPQRSEGERCQRRSFTIALRIQFDAQRLTQEIQREQRHGDEQARP
jgi:hypothetical protein